jgi:hypothetical protein
VGQPFASRLGDQRFASNNRTGFLLLALSRYRLLFMFQVTFRDMVDGLSFLRLSSISLKNLSVLLVSARTSSFFGSHEIMYKFRSTVCEDDILPLLYRALHCLCRQVQRGWISGL